jgi:hypothetical protein
VVIVLGELGELRAPPLFTLFAIVDPELDVERGDTTLGEVEMIRSEEKTILRSRLRLDEAILTLRLAR